MPQRALAHALAVHERSEARFVVADREILARANDPGVIARHLVVVQQQIVADAPPDRESVFIDADHASSLLVVEFKPGFGQWNSCRIILLWLGSGNFPGIQMIPVQDCIEYNVSSHLKVLQYQK